MIRIDHREIEALAKHLASVSKNFKQAQQRVLSSTQRATKTHVKREIAKVYTLPQARIAKGLDVSKVDKSALAFTVSGRKRVIGLQNFAHRANEKRGVLVKTLKAGGYSPLKDKRGSSKAFLAKGRAFPTKNGAPGESSGFRIFMRKDYRPLPIFSLSGPSMADMLSRSTVSVAIYKFAFEKIGSELQRQIMVALKNG